MKARIRQHLTITKKEWNGLVVLVILIAGVLVAPYFYQLFRKDNTINVKDFERAAAQVNALEKQGDPQEGGANAANGTNQQMFYFDPNALSIGQWEKLGLTVRQADIIQHFIEKGGHFYKNEDLKKIYSITDSDYNRLEPYIRLSALPGDKKKLKTGETIELNSADSARLTMLDGIGPSFAARIIRYRNRLGGFYNKEQLKEIYGLDSVMFDGLAGQVTVNPRLVTAIDINSVSFNQLRLFPYLTYNQVNAIVQYRTQHGKYSSIADMKNIAILDEQTLQKITPYLSFK